MKVSYAEGLGIGRRKGFIGRGAGEGAKLPARIVWPPSGGLPGFDAGAIDFRRRLAVVGAVGAVIVVEAEVGVQITFGLHQVGVGLEVNLLVFDRTPEPLDEDIILNSAVEPSG